MITSIRVCIAHNDLWAWSISSRSFRHDFAIRLLKYVHPAWRVRSVALTVLDGFFPYKAHIITTVRGCIAHSDPWPWHIFKVIQAWLCNKTAKIWHIFLSPLHHVQFWMYSFPIWHKWSFAWEGVPCAMTFDLDLYLQGHSAMTLKKKLLKYGTSCRVSLFSTNDH